ncbi:MAG: hypothetical protein HY519_01745 [Candidatus Aenigmarchaeota archaeon]|nr:hypothetical protein [Candidatus Aenigmarchaeota archaeon]
MGIVDWLRKLGIFRSGVVAKKYTSGRDKPIELISEDVFDGKKDIMFNLDKKKIVKKKK